MKYYLNNPLANNGIKPEMQAAELLDATKIDYKSFFAGLAPEDEVVLIGGDGTINHLINAVDCDTLENKVYLFGNGSGNDFLNDIGEKPGKEILLNPYLKNLPKARVNGKEWKYINNMSWAGTSQPKVIDFDLSQTGQALEPGRGCVLRFSHANAAGNIDRTRAYLVNVQLKYQ